MDAVKRVVKVENTTAESLNLRRIFGACGEMQVRLVPKIQILIFDRRRAIHASGFIEFAGHVEGAVSLKLDIPGVRVLALTSKRLIDQYRVVNPSALTEGGDRQSSFGTSRSSGVRNDHSLSSPVPETGLLLRTLKSAGTLVSQQLSGPPADIVENLSTFRNDAVQAATTPPVPASSRSVPHPSLPAPSSTPSAANPFPCIENRILMRLCGENITLDLSSLAGDPSTVIELLKVTLSERGNWLIVGAYYRRTGNPAAAIAVVTAMLEGGQLQFRLAVKLTGFRSRALKQFNIADNDLKPAFLLLSGCETDLGKLARSKGDADKVSEHYSNAQKWLHRIYGANSPPLPSNSPSEDTPKGKPTPPRAPTSLQSRIDTSGPAPSAPRSDSRLLEREIQSLRARNSHNTNVLADMRVSKRKLEDLVEVERVVRRRLQHELDKVGKERDNARRMEILALDQMKREVDSRRRAEDRADEERELRKRAERSAEFELLQRTAYTGVLAAPMHHPEGFYHKESFPPAFDPHARRISF
ncbi:hypothetical protein C8R45DRAFT_1126457 [Mycena sanguinolenta]|nr:hypothetical protein C8R45DRAFT_1126457 [Mycena sanguinolenta]